MGEPAQSGPDSATRPRLRPILGEFNPDRDMVKHLLGLHPPAMYAPWSIISFLALAYPSRWRSGLSSRLHFCRLALLRRMSSQAKRQPLRVASARTD
jgi:hypothetical protein